MPRRNYNPRAGRRRPASHSSEALKYLAELIAYDRTRRHQTRTQLKEN